MPNQFDDATHRDMLSLAGSRRDVYQFLSNAFLQPPSEAFVQQVCRPEFARHMAELFDPKTVEPLVLLANNECAAQELHRQIHQTFMNLFKVPGGQYVTPYESVFCDEREIDGHPVKGLLMGPSALSAKRYYRMAAMEISDEYRDLPDHVGLELHFLSRLCDKEVEFAESGDDDKLARAREMQRDFLAVHLTRWLDKLRDKIHQKTKHPFYRVIADMVVEFTRRDLATLENLLGESTAKPMTRFDEVEKP